jgi:5-(carboxyamino)imidazole ribonucleotide mutase
MPPGIPVATVAINGAQNAGLLAAKILATSDDKLSKRLKEYAEELNQTVHKKAEKLEAMKYEEYLKQM